MPALTDLLAQVVGPTGQLMVKPGTWVQLLNNTTSVSYVSSSGADLTGIVPFTNVPPGSYTIKTGIAQSGPFVATTETNYLVPPIDATGNVVPAGLVGSTSTTRWVGATPFGPPTSGAYLSGDWIISKATSTIWVCTVAGTPGTWIPSSGIYNVKDYGALGNGQLVADGAMASGSAVLTSASGKFTAGDVGKIITVFGAGAAGATLRTTVLSFQSATQVTLNASNTSGGAVNAKSVFWATDDGAAVQLAENTATLARGQVYFPPGLYLIDTSVIPKSNVYHYATARTVTLYRTVVGNIFDGTTPTGLTGVSWVGIDADCRLLGWSYLALTGSDAAGPLQDILVRDNRMQFPSSTWMIQFNYAILDPAIPTQKNVNIRLEDCKDDAAGQTFNLENIIFVNCQDCVLSGNRFTNATAAMAAHVAVYGYNRNIRFIGNYTENWACSYAYYVIQSDTISFIGDNLRTTTAQTCIQIFNSRDINVIGGSQVTNGNGTGVSIHDFGGATFDSHTNLYTGTQGLHVADGRHDTMFAVVALDLDQVQGQLDISVTDNMVTPNRCLFYIKNMPAAPSAPIQRILVSGNHVMSHNGFSGGVACVAIAGNAAAANGGIRHVKVSDNLFAASGAGGAGTDIEVLNLADDVVISNNHHLGSSTPIVVAAAATNIRILKNVGAERQAPAFVASFTPNFASGQIISLGALTANVTVNAPTPNPAIGQELTIIFLQDGTGGRTVTWNAIFKTAFQPVGLANAISAISFTFDGVSWQQTAGQIGVDALGNATVVGNLTFAAHLISSAVGTPTTGALGANVTSVTFTGNDTRGKIVIVMAGALAANTRIATCTWAATFGAITSIPLLVSETSGAGLAIVNFYSGAETATTFDLFCEQALAAGTYTVRYVNIG